MNSPRFSVMLTDIVSGQVSYLSHRGRMAWTKRTAARHFRDVLATMQSHSALIVPAPEPCQ